MATVYADTPHNFHEIEALIVNDTKTAVEEIYRKKCFFYDACSFRRHANLGDQANCLLQYIKRQNGIVVITRCILMELASHSGVLNEEYVAYIRRVKCFGIEVLVIYEEDLFAVLDACFSTNAAINQYLVWAVRMIKNPTSTIIRTIGQNGSLYDEVVKGKGLERGGLYRHFFQTVRGNKESGDNLGEELLAICLHILSHLPGEDDGKFCIITDDKSAAGTIDRLFKNTPKQYKGKQVILFSTPKLVQVMYRENILSDREQMKVLLNAGTNGHVAVLGTRIFDLRCEEISMCCDELVDLLVTPNGIHITF